MEAGELSCLEFRREAGVSPRALSDAVRQHRERCSSCGDYLKRLLEIEERVENAARVPVPEGLAERVLLRHGLAAPGRRAWMAKAAGLAAAVATGGWLIHVGDGYAARPALAAIDHVVEEEPHELAMGRTGDERILPLVLQAAGLALPAGAEVRYIGTCAVHQSYVHHVIIRMPFGTARLLVFPDVTTRSVVVAEKGGVWARIERANVGSFAVVADSRDYAERVARAVLA